MACSWDPALGEQIGQAMGEEAAAQEVAVLLGPGLNTKRSPLCGRNFEYFSEDPYLSGKMAASYVRGIQSNGISDSFMEESPPAPSTSPSTARSCAAWRRTLWWMNALCGNCT